MLEPRRTHFFISAPRTSHNLAAARNCFNSFSAPLVTSSAHWIFIWAARTHLCLLGRHRRECAPIWLLRSWIICWITRSVCCMRKLIWNLHFRCSIHNLYQIFLTLWFKNMYSPKYLKHKRFLLIFLNAIFNEELGTYGDKKRLYIPWHDGNFSWIFDTQKDNAAEEIDSCQVSYNVAFISFISLWKWFLNLTYRLS